jgi:hypothetical protein
LELDSIWWPRPSEARSTWRRSRFDVETDCCGSGAFAGKDDVCLASLTRAHRRALCEVRLRIGWPNWFKAKGRRIGPTSWRSSRGR